MMHDFTVVQSVLYDQQLATSDTWTQMVAFFNGDLSMLAKVMMIPAIDSLKGQCHLVDDLPHSPYRFKLAIACFIAAITSGIIIRRYIYPLHCRLLRYLTNDYRGMFLHSDWRFRCCAVKTIKKLEMGFAHPCGFEKWSWDYMNHTLTGLIFLARAHIYENDLLMLLGIILNTALCDVNDLTNWVSFGEFFGTREYRKNKFYSCSNSRSTFMDITHECHPTILMLVFHHFWSMLALFVVIYSGLYRFHIVAWAYYLVLLPGTTPALAAMLVSQWSRSPMLRYSTSIASCIITHTVRIDAFLLMCLFVLEKTCMAPFYWYGIPPIVGLAIFSIIASVNSLDTILPPAYLSNGTMIPEESEPFPLSCSKKHSNDCFQERMHQRWSAPPSFGTPPTVDVSDDTKADQENEIPYSRKSIL